MTVPAHADPRLTTGQRIVAAELAIAGVAERAAAVRAILAELVECERLGPANRPRRDAHDSLSATAPEHEA